MAARMGFTIPITPFTVRETCALAREAEQRGYTDAWSAEVNGADGFAIASAVGVATEALRIGSAIIPVYTRPPALIAMGAATAQSASDGRFCLGLGASSAVIVDQWMGGAFERPVTRMRETVQAVRSALSGGKVSIDGKTVRVHGFRLEAAPASAVPIYIAALGPQMRRLAVEEAQGIALFLATEEGVRLTREAAPELELIQRIFCFVDQDPDQVRDACRWLFAPYLAVPGYSRFIAEQGFGEEAEAARTAWGSGDRKAAVAALSDRLVDALAISGSAERCKERLSALRDAGLDTPIVALLNISMDKHAIEKALFALAPT
ncbi:MAG: LLM class F420-dependent oxidoreductase [Actinomycetota bacterium]|nr:LLM class F420-dependent oxidoreductase [Actinomycetota bacterium]